MLINEVVSNMPHVVLGLLPNIYALKKIIRRKQNEYKSPLLNPNNFQKSVISEDNKKRIWL